MDRRTHDATEYRITVRLVRDALAAGYCLSVNDGEETTLRHSSSEPAILAAMATTDSDVLTAHDRLTGEPVGWVTLIYGNGTDLIADNLDNGATAAWLAGAEALANHIAEDQA